MSHQFETLSSLLDLEHIVAAEPSAVASTLFPPVVARRVSALDRRSPVGILAPGVGEEGTETVGDSLGPFARSNQVGRTRSQLWKGKRSKSAGVRRKECRIDSLADQRSRP